MIRIYKTTRKNRDVTYYNLYRFKNDLFIVTISSYHFNEMLRVAKIFRMNREQYTFRTVLQHCKINQSQSSPGVLENVKTDRSTSVNHGQPPSTTFNDTADGPAKSDTTKRMVETRKENRMGCLPSFFNWWFRSRNHPL